MGPANEFLPYAADSAVFVLEPQVRKALGGRPAEFARAVGAALAWEYSGKLCWIVEQPHASFSIDNGAFVSRDVPVNLSPGDASSFEIEAGPDGNPSASTQPVRYYR